MIKFSKPGLVAYLTVGDPSISASETIALAAIDAGADVIELGVPFSDPVADGPVIQRASERALRNAVSLQEVIALGGALRKQRPQAGLIVFSYLNPIIRLGFKRFVVELGQAGVDGGLIIDLTVEESGAYRQLMSQAGLSTIFLAAPTSTDARLEAIAKASSGFVYAVSRTGITGTENRADLRGETEKLVRRIRRFTELPVAVGFGISTPQQFQEVAGFADAAVIGSAIVRLIEDDPAHAAKSVADWIESLRSGSRGAAGSRK